MCELINVNIVQKVDMHKKLLVTISEESYINTRNVTLYL